ncbi:uncharacterized protein LACBIDRAFT_317315 [Laccaria bicolor S238N-H82]|uniref:Predicted protein n=1 Tax=Laccaria bicolor (strain S238N-H82 / ATCC MYA-4686) TaxID=486041 RepID=B0D4W4_LACBS|nr:uncharacterized protein LACBIDRAFT_317315 [Laccaria bicolor S238N-H82]EDR10633.1 predicted protein [Laccaria bicolor S238N-H82]|eukprot:XP_001879083.1 predicted protein [Laccaria bicolor S238N-H82]
MLIGYPNRNVDHQSDLWRWLPFPIEFLPERSGPSGSVEIISKPCQICSASRLVGRCWVCRCWCGMTVAGMAGSCIWLSAFEKGIPGGY